MNKRRSVQSKRWVLAMSLPLIGVSQSRAGDSVGISHETCAEEHSRIQVNTETLRIEKTITPWLDLTLREVYDGISGATPTGAPAIRQLKMRDPGTGALIPPSTITGYTRQLDGVSGASGMGIDLGGIGKEFAVDHLVSMARKRGISDMMIDIGQDIRVAGHPPGKDAWHIGLEEPDHPGNCWTALRLTDQAVATSGDYFRSFKMGEKTYGHILDPRSGLPVSNNSQSVSVIAPSCAMARILSTAAFILGAETGLDLIREHPGVEACITTETARHQTRKFSSYVPA